jgi:hypothetical protein
MYIRPELISGGSAPKSMSIPDFLVESANRPGDLWHRIHAGDVGHNGRSAKQVMKQVRVFAKRDGDDVKHDIDGPSLHCETLRHFRVGFMQIRERHRRFGRGREGRAASTG